MHAVELSVQNYGREVGIAGSLLFFKSSRQQAVLCEAASTMAVRVVEYRRWSYNVKPHDSH